VSDESRRPRKILAAGGRIGECNIMTDPMALTGRAGEFGAGC
jgi:hypothetical protein